MSNKIAVYEKSDGTLTTKPQQEFVHSTYRGALAYSGYYQNKKPIGYLVIEDKSHTPEQEKK